MKRHLGVSEMNISAKGYPANRESELRDCLELIRTGQVALQMRDGVTSAECAAYARQAEFLIGAAHARYRAPYKATDA